MQPLNAPSKEKWQRIGQEKKAGALVPLFSVYSQKSSGIADFFDLKLLIDWAAASANSILQLLPVNELGPLFCPYDSVSSFALEPAYISFDAFSASGKKPLKNTIDSLRNDFPLSAGYLDYSVKEAKIRLLREIYTREDGADNKKFTKFISDNSYWLWDFALFKTIKYHYQGRAWWDWQEKFKGRDRVTLEGFYKEHKEEISFQIWLQWLAFEQLKEAKKHAARKNVLMKGDLPILVSRDSADVWAHPEFFKLDFAAGAPPDMYCAKGQRWGMPTYNWERIAADGFAYLKEKLKYAENFYDILRIDHVVGLFRIWSIAQNEPLENQGLNGFFDPFDERLWHEHGRNLLSVILDNTKMLLCAEDLGVIPKACTDTLAELGIPGNDVQRWMKDWNVKHDFLTPQGWRPLAVAMLSTHDTTNWAAWWEDEAGTVDEGLFMRKCHSRNIDYSRVKDELFDQKRSRYGRLRWKDEVDSIDKLLWILGKRREEVGDFIELYENTYAEKEKLWKHLGMKGKMKEKSSADIVRRAIKLSLDSSAIFSVNTLIDYLYLSDEFKGDPCQYRINTPGTVSPKNWSQVLPLSLEELLKHKITKDIRKMIADSRRV